jgi:hypothetical protein
MGDSRGRWEGNTLVVETANYKAGPPMINLAVVGSPAGTRFPVSNRMKTTERITRLNDDMFLYEIKTEDPIILTRSFTVRYPMRNDPTYKWWEYACHEGNTIVPNYVTTNRYEREHPSPEPPPQRAQVSADVADALAGRWVGRPRIVTIDLDIELAFTKNADGSVQGSLIGTNLGRIDKALRDFKMDGRRMDFEFPNTQPWGFSGELAADGASIVGVLNNVQGNLPVTFRKR